jgi:hypothetical protein
LLAQCETGINGLFRLPRSPKWLSAQKTFTPGGMKILAARIKRQLLLDTGKWGRCAIYENELQRIWPLNEENRKQKIEQFAKEYGFRLSYYKPGLCAIFERARSDSEGQSA